MKVKVLGTDYKIKFDYPEKNIKLKDANGYVEFYAKEIVLEKYTQEKLKNPELIKNIEEFRKKVLRHEIAHAFLYESGLREYAENEQLVDFIAIQIEKIYNACKIAEKYIK